MDVVLGGAGMPVRGTDAERAAELDAKLARDLRATADRVAHEKGGVGGVLESISLLGRLDHIRSQLADFPSWDDDLPRMEA